jgi:hypothetical protein
MLKKIATCSIVFLIILLSYAVQTIESQEDYSYILGVWETKTGGRTAEITIKEISQTKNKAVIFMKYSELQTPQVSIPAGSYEVNNAEFKPGPEPVIEFKNPTNGFQNSFSFKRDGTAVSKTITGRGGAAGIQYGDWKKK